MTTLNEESILRGLSDDEDAFEKEKGVFMFRRHGQEMAVEVKQKAGFGSVVVSRGAADVPFHEYVQRDLLKLNSLAQQIAHVLSAKEQSRPISYIESQIRRVEGGGAESALPLLEKEITDRPLDTTSVIRLMGNAGTGKTVCLEKLSCNFAKKYQPRLNPIPIILPVDLLGRYVGSIEDAIAGSINNTFMCPTLTQRDVILSMRLGWIALALDGFDELVARIGVANTFSHLSELFDDLVSDGVVILSARSSFFTLYEIRNGINKHLRPKSGSYQSVDLEVCDWGHEQGLQAFRLGGSSDPEGHLKHFEEIFPADSHSLLFHPFYLTRIAKFHLNDREESDAKALSGYMPRAQWIIDTYLEREHGEKWKDRKTNPILTVDDHKFLLGSIAEEMFRVGAYKLKHDELEQIAEISCMEMGKDDTITGLVKERIGSHAALTVSGGYISFFHEEFLSFSLGYRLTKVVLKNYMPSIKAMVSGSELSPAVLKWFSHFLAQSDAGESGVSYHNVVRFLQQLPKHLEGNIIGLVNIGLLVAQCISVKTAMAVEGDACQVSGILFMGVAFENLEIENVNFESCRFVNLDLGNSKFDTCRFLGCEFASISAGKNGVWSNCEMVDCKFDAFEKADGRPLFDPREIVEYLSQLPGVLVKASLGTQESLIEVTGRQLSDRQKELRECIHEVVFWTNRRSDVSTDDIIESFGDNGDRVVKIGISTGVFRSVNRPTSGHKKTFVRFSVDRQELLRGEAAKTGNQSIDRFWNDLRAAVQ